MTTLPRIVCIIALGLLYVRATAQGASPNPKPSDVPFSMVVMDPLAAPLSCPCVAGYAQRKYEVLGEYLSQKLGRPVEVTFAETIAGALEKLAEKKIHGVDLVIGKDSVIRAEGRKLKLGTKPLAHLTGKDGKTSMTGLIVVRSQDSAKAVEDLKGYRILFGPPDCDEKFAAARKILEKAGVEIPAPEKCETSEACSDGACKIIEWGDSEQAAAVISSYAAPLLEGCGTIKKGDLRVVAETKPVPFITAFATKQLAKAERDALEEALLDAASAPNMLTALESLMGFLPLDQEALMPKLPTSSKAAGDKADEKPATSHIWPGWLGPERNGHCEWLPDRLPAKPRIVWRRALSRSGLGGLAATDRFVLVGDRDPANVSDVFRCFDAETGDPLWTVTYPAPGRLDYDNAPRATPLVQNDRAYFFGAFGDLTCAAIETGEVLWRINVRREFLATDELPWGTCSTPLLIDDVVVVNPGAPDASLVGIDAETGEVRWQTPGEPQGHGSLIVATLGGVKQIVGHTATKLCGWSAETGEQIWEVAPPEEGDFNVPTPAILGDKLLICTENNGSRLFAFTDDGKIVPEPESVNQQLHPQMSTPVVVGSRVFCASDRLHCLDGNDGLKTLWKGQDSSFGEVGPLIASGNRLLGLGRGCELLLIDSTADSFKLLDRSSALVDEATKSVEPYSFPAIVGTRLFVRSEHEVVCVDLAS